CSSAAPRPRSTRPPERSRPRSPRSTVGRTAARASPHLEIDVARTTCSYCPKLDRHVCPAAIAERSEVATPTFKQQVAKLGSAGALPLDEEAARVLYKCRGCLASKAVCRHSVDVEVSLRDARGLAVRAGTAPPEVFDVKARFEARGCPFDQDLRAKVPAI